VAGFRWGIISAVLALVISIGLGIISGVSYFYIILRGFIFALFFFGIGFGLRFIISSFFPELLFSDDENGDFSSFDQPGSRVNITVDATGEYAVPELYKTPNNELGNIEELISGFFRPRTEGIDRNQEEGYNEQGSFQDESMDTFGSIIRTPAVLPQAENIDFQDMFQDTSIIESAPVSKPVFTPSFGDDSGGLGGLPDLDALGMAFSPASGFSGSGGSSAVNNAPVNTPEPVLSEPEEFEPERSRYIESKPQQLKGDFNPKELAEGIRTALNKDKDK
jgi:hypothetical protein